MDNHGLDTQLLARFLKSRYHDEKLAEVISVDVKNAVPKGQNFASIVYRVKLTGLTAAGRKKTFSIIVKTELNAGGSRKLLREFQVFAVETRIFRNILPMMEELMENVGDKREKLWPDLLGFLPYTLIAFDDLSDKGYTGAERKKYMDFNHTKLVLRNLARFHALSKVLLASGQITADDKGRLGLAEDNSQSRKLWNVIITVLTDAMVTDWGDEWKQIADRLRIRANVMSRDISVIAQTYDKRFEVLNHGDLWTCNLLFKYMEQEENFPIEVKFVDYQVCHINSFIWDVVHFLFSSTVPSVRRSRLNELLEAYHQSLEANLKLFNFTDYIPSMEDLKSEWKRMELIGFCGCLTHLLLIAEAERPFDRDKINTHPPHEVIDKSVFAKEKAMITVGEDIKNFALNGTI